MEEVFDKKLKVQRPITATIGGIVTLLAGVSAMILYFIGMNYIIESGFLPSYISDVFWEFIVYILIIISGFLILLRKYKVGGAISIVFGIIIAIGYWELGIWCIIGGILGLISKEKIDEHVLLAAKQFGRIKISELAKKIAKTEADVELAVKNLQSKGELIKFDAETREVISESRT
ncbi:MAG: hypothetical protein NTX92_09300 [Euryarchaeota archaeon]|jgi:hypothetical protein|nr:hypothetical protein [Euryarchaeota archaeon]